MFFGSLCAIVYGHKIFYSLKLKKKKSLLDFTNSNFGEDPQVYCVSKKDEREEITKWIWTTIYTKMIMTLQ